MSVTDIKKNEESVPVQREEARTRVAPPVDVFENDTEILLVADLPGVRPDALDVRLEDGELTLTGRWSDDAEGRVLAADFRAVDYVRTFVVPEGIDPAKVHAQMRDGVVKVHLPKAEAFRPRQIPVRAG